jgi:hypothetical protein
MKDPERFLALENAMAFCILLGEMSQPTTSHPSSAKGSKFPPSPQPTSRILQAGERL